MRTTRPGHTELKAEYIVQFAHDRPQKYTAKAEVLTSDMREKLLQTENEVINKNILSLLGRMSQNGIDKHGLLESIYRYVHNKVADEPRYINNDIPSVLKTNRATALGRARLMVALCRAANYPARMVAGFVLNEKPNALPHFWVEVFHNDKWQPYGPTNGYAQQLPSNYLPLKLGDSDIVKYPEIVTPAISYRVEIDTEHPDSLMTSGREVLDIFIS